MTVRDALLAKDAMLKGKTMCEASSITAPSAVSSPVLTSSDVESHMKPCPFCGAGESRVDDQYLAPRMDGPGALISVVVRHWCPPGPWGHSLYHEFRARDFESALAGWNKRAGDKT